MPTTRCRSGVNWCSRTSCEGDGRVSDPEHVIAVSPGAEPCRRQAPAAEFYIAGTYWKSTLVGSVEFTAPHAKSWLDRGTEWIERIPLPTWLFYGLFAAASIALGSVFHPTTTDVPGWMLTILTPATIGLFHWLRRSTANAFAKSRPALALSEAAKDDLAYRLTYAPARSAWLFTIIEAIYLPIYVMSEAESMGYRFLPIGALVPGVIMWAFGEAFVWMITYQTIRRFILIARIPKQLARVELFRQQPLHALSTVTRRGALGLFLTYGYPPAMTLGRAVVQDPLYLASLAIGAVLAALAAVVPLFGTHQALAEERRARATATGHRIQVAADALDEAIDAGDLDAVDRELKALGALKTQKDLIDGASTWPWPPGTVRNVASTVLVPLFLLLARELATQFL